MKSPYLKDHRLPDVIAAITAMAIYPYYKQTAAEWADRIGGSKDSSDRWRVVFEEHPEFFRRGANSNDYSLVWRRQLPDL